MSESPSTFDIRQHVAFDPRGRAVCPSCRRDKGERYGKKNLSLVPNTERAYKCHRGCSPQEIREALGQLPSRIVPTAIACQSKPPASVTISAKQVGRAHRKLFSQNGPARQWLRDRGITEEMAAHYQLGIALKPGSDLDLWAISIPIPAGDGKYYRKLRIAPWLSADRLPADYQPWSQYGVPATVYFTHQPAEATQTYLCEGEWDAIVLGWKLRHQSDIAVACFTCGCNTVPSAEVLERLPGRVTIFYDRNDKPLKNGTVPGEAGAQKVAQALGDRARIALVPQRPEHAQICGWDVSDALSAGFALADFAEAAERAVPFVPPAQATPVKDSDVANPLRSRLVHNDTLLDRAPDYTEWLVPDLLTANELFLLAASPRAGKSLLAMTLALSIASGQKFLDRPVTQGSVLYICCEDSETKIKEREIAQGWTRGLPVYWLDRFKLSELSHLRAIAEELEPRLIVFDTLSRIRDDGISESSAEMSRCLEPLQEMAEELNCCILLVHHTGKVKLDNADKIDVFETIRGSSAIRAVCRGSWVLAADDNSCYRLCVEHGYGKEDLRLALDASTLRWQSLGGWQPAMVNPTQAERVLDYLNREREGTIDQIHAATGLPKRSLYVVLSRLHADEVVSKSGDRRQIVYTFCGCPLHRREGDGEDAADSTSSREIPSEMRVSSDLVMDSPREEKVVISNAKQTSIPLCEGDTASQHSSNNLLTSLNLLDEIEQVSPVMPNDHSSLKSSVSHKQVKFTRGDPVEFFDGLKWVPGRYKSPVDCLYFSPISRQLEDCHLIQIVEGKNVGISRKTATSALRYRCLKTIQ